MAVGAARQLCERDSRAGSFCILFSLSLLGILLFSKQSLEPAVSSFTDKFLFSTQPQKPLAAAAAPILIRAPEIQHSSLDSPPETPSPDGDGSVPSPPMEAHEHTESSPPTIQVARKGEKPQEVAEGGGGNGPVETLGSEGKCDLFEGSWAEDEEGRYPLYRPGSCPYVDDAFTCQENGRPDNAYLKWRWKPHGCDLPR